MLEAPLEAVYNRRPRMMPATAALAWQSWRPATRGGSVSAENNQMGGPVRSSGSRYRCSSRAPVVQNRNDPPLRVVFRGRRATPGVVANVLEA